MKIRVKAHETSKTSARPAEHLVTIAHFERVAFGWLRSCFWDVIVAKANKQVPRIFVCRVCFAGTQNVISLADDKTPSPKPTLASPTN